MTVYDPNWTSNINDTNEDYCFGSQPKKVLWNVTRLSRTFLNLVGASCAAKSTQITKPISATPIHPTEKMNAFPPKQQPLDLYINPQNSEIILNHLVGQFIPMFETAYTDLMLAVVMAHLEIAH